MTTVTQRTNQSSLLLSTEENQDIFSRIGPQSTTSVVGVSQLFTTEAPNHSKWIYQGSGAACLVRDASRKSYFIRFISMDGHNVDMEQELYKTIVLYKSSNHFLAFEAHSCLWGLLFCEKSEFHLFEEEILAKIRPKNKSRVDKKASIQIAKSKKKSQKQPKKSEPSESQPAEKKRKSEKVKSKKSQKTEKPRLEISGPSNFVVVTHVGHDGITGIENMQDSDKWKELIQFLYGSTSAEITTEETSHMIDLVAKSGGIDKYANAIEKKKNKHVKATKKKDAIERAAPPPPAHKAQAASSSKASPPPPPPPPPAGVAPPPPPSGAPPAPSKPLAPAKSLHEQIHKGKVLKKVEIVEASSDEDEEGLLGALVNNLAAFRSKVKASSSEGESDGFRDESDDEW